MTPEREAGIRKYVNSVGVTTSGDAGWLAGYCRALLAELDRVREKHNRDARKESAKLLKALRGIGRAERERDAALALLREVRYRDGVCVGCDERCPAGCAPDCRLDALLQRPEQHESRDGAGSDEQGQAVRA